MNLHNDLNNAHREFSTISTLASALLFWRPSPASRCSLKRSHQPVRWVLLSAALVGIAGCRNVEDSSSGRTSKDTASKIGRETSAIRPAIAEPGTISAPTPPVPPGAPSPSNSTTPAQSRLNDKMADAPMESAYMQGVQLVSTSLDQSRRDFDRVSKTSASAAELSAMLSSNQTLVSSALSQLDLLNPTPRFHVAHEDLRQGIKTLGAALTDLKRALYNEDAQAVGAGLATVNASYRAIGEAQMKLGSLMKAYSLEMKNSARDASPQ